MPRARSDSSLQPSPEALERLRGPLVVLAIVAVAAALKLTSSVTMPLAFALFLAALLEPVQSRLERSVPTGVALLITMLLVVGVAALLVWALMLAADAVAERVPYYAQRVEALKGSIIEGADAWGLELSEEQLGWTNMISQLGGGAGSIVRVLMVRAGFIVLVIGFWVLAMLEIHRWRARLADALDDGKARRVLAAARTVAEGFRSYVATRTLTSAATGVLTGLLLWAFGVDFPLLWGVVAYLLNYIPTVGSLVAVTPPSLLAALQYGSLGMGLGVLAAQTVLQLIIGQYVDPRLQGKNLQLSPLLVLFAIMFWGWMWGAAGALIAIPLTVAIVIGCRQFENSRWIAEMVSDAGEDE